MLQRHAFRAKRILALALTLFATCSMASAERRSQRFTPAGWPWDTIPHVADGANWKTTIILTNLENRAANYKLDFFTNDGRKMVFEINGHGIKDSFSGVIPKNGMVTLETAGKSATLNQGWAGLDLVSDNVGIMAIFGTTGIPGRPDFEATITGATLVDFSGTIAFDNTNGYNTSIAILNPTLFADSTVPVSIYDQFGVLVKGETITLRAGNKQAFAIADRWPETRGKRGVIHFDGALTGWTGFGLRFNPNGAFTTIPLMDK